ncbi:MAG: SDR family NAD(P)-dependent oxidoreductase [Burkholderiales bacterium]
MTAANQPGVAIFGATSAIAQAVARIYAGEGARLFLAGRNETHLDAIASDLRVRGATDVRVHVVDFGVANSCASACEAARAELGRIDVALIAHGTNVDQASCERDDAALREAIQVNFTSYASLLVRIAAIMEAQRSGSLVAIGSAAGDRGKRRNYIYGSAKAGIAVLMEGLMGRLSRAGVRVTLVKPGFVDTPMTASFRKGPLWISSSTAGRLIVRAVRAGKSTVYIPGFWRWVMTVLSLVPQRIFARLDL